MIHKSGMLPLRSGEDSSKRAECALKRNCIFPLFLLQGMYVIIYTYLHANTSSICE